MIVCPYTEFKSLSIFKTIREFSESRLPVGSSASRIAGRLMTARAMATRCCSPPDQGTASLWRPFPVNPNLLSFEFPLMVGLSLLLLIMLWVRPRIHRWQGILLLVIYLTFVFGQIQQG